MANLFIDEEFLDNMANAIIKQNKVYGTIDDYIISNEGLNPQQFADAIRHLDVAPLKQRPITKASLETNHIGIIEYKPTNADCWGSITVNVSEEERLKYRQEELNIPPFNTISDADLVNVVERMNRGEILPEETGWKVGDERVVRLNAMSALSPLTDTHITQDVTFVIMDSGHYDLVTPTQNGRTKDHFVIGQKECLKQYSGINIDSSEQTDCWSDSLRRRWCNEKYYYAIPSSIRSIFKQFKIITTSNYAVSPSAPITTFDYFSFFSANEIDSSDMDSSYYDRINSSQIKYFKNKENWFRNTTINNGWWTRSHYHNVPREYMQVFHVHRETEDNYCAITRTGESIRNGIAPFGCI